MNSHARRRRMWLSLLGLVAIAGTIEGCGQTAAGTLGARSVQEAHPVPGQEAHPVPWNSPFLKGWASGKVRQPPVTAASVTAAEHRLAGRRLPFKIRALSSLGQPFRVLTDPWPSSPSVHGAAVALQYHTPHGLADVIETYPGSSEKEFEREARSFIYATPPPGTTVTEVGRALIVSVDGRYFGFMTLGADGASATLAWHEGKASYLVEGPSLGKAYSLQLADELASQ
jgi:hypothetical protein